MSEVATRPASILDWMDNPELFGPYFKGESWTAWRSFLASVFALPMDETALKLYQRHTGRTIPPVEPFDEVALGCGRRAGKSRILATIAVYIATYRDYAPFLGPGEIATVGVLASNRSQARSIFRFCLGLLTAVPVLKDMILDQNGEQIMLNNRLQIEISTASWRSTRGYNYAAVLCDEIAFWRQDDSSANPDKEILRAIRPGLANIPGSILMLASSPYAKKGELYTSYRRYYGRDDGDVLFWKAPTLAMHDTPRLRREREKDFESDAESARAEWDSEFREDLADFISREQIDAVTCWGRRELPPEPGVTYRAFLDPSGGSIDSAVLAIAHQSGGMGILDCLVEIVSPHNTDTAVLEFVAVLARYGVTRCVADRFGGQWVVARFAEHGIVVEQCARPKSELYLDFLPLANACRVELLDNPRLASQFCNLERRTGRSGKDSVAEPSGQGTHDDCCNACAGVLVNLDLDRRPALIKKADLAPDAPPAIHLRPERLFTTTWVGLDGLAGWILFSYARHETPRLIICDFDFVPWSASLLPQIATALDAACEATQKPRQRMPFPPSAIMHVPRQLLQQARDAMRLAFVSRLDWPDVQFRRLEVQPLRMEQLADTTQLILNCAAHVGSGAVRLSATAMQRSETVPLLGVVGVAPGERVEANALRVAFALGVSQLDEARALPQAAKIQFG